jgi:glycosyltransferase involved in cell wall biosynthesis
MRKLKILYYNWVDFEDEQRRGGGVSIYQRNVIDAAVRKGDEVWYFSSGVSYSPFSRRPYMREVQSKTKGVRKFEIVNSTILSPGQEAFGQDVTQCPQMDPLFAEFLREHGPFDVIHFNNLEGIPLSFLRLGREHYPQTKIIYSVHNYFAFCPQVNLWFQEQSSCRDFRDGRKCVNCLPHLLHPRGTQRMYRLEYLLAMFGISPNSVTHRFANWAIFGFLRSLYHLARSGYRWYKAGKQGKPDPSWGARSATQAVAILDPAAAERFVQRRHAFVDALNRYVDSVLPVSQRVAELTVGFGIDPAKVQTLYIGTRFAEQMNRDVTVRPRAPGEPLRLVYLGYMRRDKGFYFYLRSLEKMPASLARRLSLTFAAKIVDPHAYAQIKRVAHRFASVTFYDGYTHAQLPELLSGVDLAIVPVLWEDNLPQVAIECVASGVPILTSDRGGAQELLDCRDLVFRAGSCRDLYAKLRDILADPTILESAIVGRTRLFTPHEHYERLREQFYLGGCNEDVRSRGNTPFADRQYVGISQS